MDHDIAWLRGISVVHLAVHAAEPGHAGPTRIGTRLRDLRGNSWNAAAIDVARLGSAWRPTRAWVLGQGADAAPGSGVSGGERAGPQGPGQADRAANDRRDGHGSRGRTVRRRLVSG